MNFPLICYKNVGRTFVRFVTIHAFDGQTYGQTDAHRKTSLAYLRLTHRYCVFFKGCALKKQSSLFWPGATVRFAAIWNYYKITYQKLRVSKAVSHFNGLVLVSISNVGFQLFLRMVLLSEVKVKKVKWTWSEALMTEQKVSLSFYSRVAFLCVLKHFHNGNAVPMRMETPFPCVPAAFQQWERRSHAFPLEMTPRTCDTMKGESLFLVSLCFPGLVQRIFKSDKIQNTVLLQIMYTEHYRSPLWVIIYKIELHSFDVVRFFWPTRYLARSGGWAESTKPGQKLSVCLSVCLTVC